ncbi:MAG: TonB-dependent receptor [Bacteroidota bacterium]
MRPFVLIICSILFFTGPNLLAQNNSERKQNGEDTVFTLSPVTVTATRAVECATPATFSNFSQQNINDRYSVQDIPVLLSEMPSAMFYSENGNGIGYSYLKLRGFDQSRVSVMVNGIPQNDPEEHNVYWIDFPDLTASTDDIQVQRGAGSAFYGPPAIGGSINLVTDPFSRKPGVTFETMFGFQEFGDSSRSISLNTRKYTTTINSGLINQQYMLYGRLGQILSDGYRVNSWTNLNSYFLGAVRFDKDMTTRFHFFGGPITDGLAYTGLPFSAKSDLKLRRQNFSGWVDTSGVFSGTMRRTQETEYYSQPHYELLNEYRLSSTQTLYNTLFLIQGDGYFDYDASWGDTSAFRIGYRYGIPATANPGNALVRGFVGNKQWGWLPRFVTETDFNSLTLGAEIRIHRSTHWGKIQYAEGLPAGFDPDYHFYEFNGSKDIASFYIHNIYHPQQQLNIMSDVQFSYNKYGIANEKPYLDANGNFVSYDFTVPYFFVNPRLGANYNFDDRWNGYVSIAYTSREPKLTDIYYAENSYGGSTPQFAVGNSGKYDFTKPIAQPEHLLDFELGTGFREGRNRLTANIYWMEFTDELVDNGRQDIYGQPLTSNADRSRHVGIELDGTIALNEMFSVSGNYSLSSNKLIHYRIEDTSGVYLYDHNPIAGFPDALGNLRGNYRDSLLTLSLAMRYIGAFYTDPAKVNMNPSYVVFNSEVSYKLPVVLNTQFTIRGEVRNIFNTLYFNTGIGEEFFPAAERNYVIGLTTSL